MKCPICKQTMLLIGAPNGPNDSGVGWECPYQIGIPYKNEGWCMPTSHYFVRENRIDLIVLPFKIETWVAPKGLDSSDVYHLVDVENKGLYWEKIFSCPPINYVSEEKLIA